MGTEKLLEGLGQLEIARRLKTSDCSRLTISHKEARGESFVGVTFLNGELRNCSFSHCHFKRCYFRKTHFNHAAFIGSRFVDCSFDQATFDGCDLSYTSYANCSISYQQVKPCLPDRQNVLHDLARDLRVNAQNRGDKTNVRHFLREELRASREHNYKKWHEVNDPYYQKYTVAQRIGAFFEWLSLKVAGWVWGYGESWLAVLRISLVIICVFGLLYWRLVKINGLPTNGLRECLLFSFATFASVGYGQALADSLWGRFCTDIEAAIGLLLFGLLVVVLYTRFSSR